MAELIIAADLGALGDAAGRLGSTFGQSEPSQQLPSLQHPEADAALSDFQSAARTHRDALAQHAGAGASALHGYMVAFEHAGD